MELTEIEQEWLEDDSYDPDMEFEMHRDMQFEWLCDQVEELRKRAETQGYDKEGFFNSLLNIIQVEVF